MPVRRRGPLAAVLAALLAALPAFGAAVLAAPAPVAPTVAPADAVTSAPKVVIVVGAVETVTSSFRTDADSIYAEAIKYTPNVVKVYSPNATWAAVSAAAQGASIFIYLGHGYGFPSPYKTVLTPSVHDGMGLNEVANNGDADKKYYGESVVSAGIKLAKNAIVILDHACYSAGSSESGMAEPTIPVAKQRVDNFASGFLRAGARAVMADASDGNVIAMIRSIFTTHQAIGDAWHGQYFANHHDIVWQSLRNPAYTSDMDPDTTTTGFHRSLVGNFLLTTDEIVGGASVPRTDTSPSALTSPGAAAVGASDASLTGDATLTGAPSASLAAGTKVQVTGLSPTPDAAEVETLDGKTAGWTATSGLIPEDSASPQLWGLDGSTTVSPNFDGDHDALTLVARFSESVSWTATVRDPANAVLKILTGSGEVAALTWSPMAGSAPLPAGDYSLAIHATDAWGNAPLDTSTVIHVVSIPTPNTGVLRFAPTKTTTNAATFTYTLVFAGPVTGLGRTDFTVTGSAPGCYVATPVGSGTTWTVTLGSCSNGYVVLSLEPKTVSDGTNAGPAGLITAYRVIVDRSAPKATAPKLGVKSNVTLSGATLQSSISWTATDVGSAGLQDYDVARSADGAAFATIASHVTSTSLSVSMSAGHTYRYEVRARDRAGNVGAWVAGSTQYPSLLQQTSTSIAWAGAWTTLTSTSYSGGSARYASAAGASASYAFTGRSVAIVLAKGPTRGAVQVWIDGALATTVDTYAAANAYGWVGYARNFGTSAAHTVKLVVVGTASRPAVVLDALEVVR